MREANALWLYEQTPEGQDNRYEAVHVEAAGPNRPKDGAPTFIVWYGPKLRNKTTIDARHIFSMDDNTKPYELPGDAPAPVATDTTNDE